MFNLNENDVLDIYESCRLGYISESERDEILDVVVTEAGIGDKELKILGGVLAGITSIIGIGALISKKKTDKEIENHPELKAINEKLKKEKDDITVLKKVLKSDSAKYFKLCNDSIRFANFFGAKTKQVYDGFFQYDDTIINRYRTEANPDYDPKKAAEWKKISEECIEVRARIKKSIKELKDHLKTTKGYVKELRKMAKKFYSTTDDAIDRLNDHIDKLEQDIEASVREVDDYINDHESLKESVDMSIDDIKLEIYESCYAGEITAEERDELLSLID